MRESERVRGREKKSVVDVALNPPSHNQPTATKITKTNKKRHLRARTLLTRRLQPDPAKFPSGIAALSQAARDRGLRLGLYLDAGALTCAGFAGSLGHETSDAAQLAEWGVDYLK